MLGSRVGVLRGNDFARCGITSSISCAAGTPTGALYIDPSGFPIRDPEIRVIMDPTPRWTGSVSTSLRYKKWNVSGLLDIRHGGQIWNGTKGALWSYGTHKDTETRATCTKSADPSTCTGNVKTFGQGGWWDGPVAGPGKGTAVSIGEPWYKFIAACPFIGIDEPCIEQGGFVKLREVSVSYTIDAPWVQRAIGFSSIDVRVSGRNLKTWTKYTGYDPETNLGGPISSAAGAGGVDYFNNPQTRSFAFAITLNH